MRRRFALALGVALVFSGAAAPARPGDDPSAPPPGAKRAEPGKDAAGDAGRDAAPAPTVDQLVADMNDDKFVIKRIDAAAAAKSVQDPKVLPPLVKLLKDEHTEVRSLAVAALGARREPEQQKKAAEALASRLKSLADKPEFGVERTQIAHALHDLAQPVSVEALLADIEAGMGLDEVEARCRAVGNVASPKAIEALIGLMQKGRRDGSGWRACCAKALEYATGERMGNDPDQWRAWWKDHEKTFDFELAADRRRREAEAKAEKEQQRQKAKERREKGKKDGKGDRDGKDDEGGGGEKKERAD